MNYLDFYQWLVQEKQLGSRSAKDVISRCKRISRIDCNEEIQYN